MSDYSVGYKKPPKEYQIGQPLGPKPGITSETRRLQIENAERATRIRQRLLEAVENIANQFGDEEALAMVDAHINKLLVDSENRGLGMPTQQVDNTSSDGSVAPTKIVVQGVAAKKDKEDDE